MELRKLSVENIEQIKEVVLDAFTGEPWYDDWHDPKQFHRYILDIIANENSLSLGLFDGDQILGVSLGRVKHWYTGNQYWIDDLGLVSNSQGKGYGTKFLFLMEEYLKENDIDKIVLLTKKDIPAYYFYAKNAFIEEDERVVYGKELK